jgi:hypothetical protein
MLKVPARAPAEAAAFAADPTASDQHRWSGCWSSGVEGVAVQVGGSPSKECGLLHVATGYGSFCGRRRRASGG